MKVLIAGSGGREHALAWSMAQSPALAELHAAPGNPGIARLGTCHPISATDSEALTALARDLSIDLAVIGPEAPLVAGVGDELRAAGIAVFGPSASAAEIEGSKSFAKDLMTTAGVATARTLGAAQAPCVIKADGLAAGKGVFVCPTQRDVDAALPRVEALGGDVLIEELLEGPEASLFAICDGTRALPLAPAQDYKRLLEGDEGPNTGGMGSFSPTPVLPSELVPEIAAAVHEPVLRELAKRGSRFVGLLYAGLMLTESGVRVLEFNCRFGDPETQALLPRLDGDLLTALAAAASGDIRGVELGTDAKKAAVTVVLASGGYPDAPETNVPITGVENAETNEALVFHAGTAIRDGELVSAGGRVLGVTGVGANVGKAREVAYAAVDRIDFPGSQFRRDLALTAAHATV